MGRRRRKENEMWKRLKMREVGEEGKGGGRRGGGEVGRRGGKEDERWRREEERSR